MPYWRLFYHVVWSTRGREALIDSTVEDLLQKAIRRTCTELDIPVHGVGAMPDHVHLAISVPPSLAVAKAVGRIKGSAAHLVNHTAPREQVFGWETEYSVHSFGARHLSEVVAYVTNQPRRHAEQKIWKSMEPNTAHIEPAQAGFVGVARPL